MIIDLRERERGRETMLWERNIDWLSPICTPTEQLNLHPTYVPWPTENQTCKILVYGTMLQPTETHQPGQYVFSEFSNYYSVSINKVITNRIWNWMEQNLTTPRLNMNGDCMGIFFCFSVSSLTILTNSNLKAIILGFLNFKSLGNYRAPSFLSTLTGYITFEYISF